jgi:hypothetical protein
VPYGTNQSPSSNVAVRPSLDSLARGQLLPTPTPTVADSRASANATAGRSIPLIGHAGRTLTDAARLLPTPRATDGVKGCPGQRGSHGDLTLPSAAVRVLPTPRASDGHGASRHGEGGVDLTTTVAGLPTELGQLNQGRWGEYATAVVRWELLLGRPVPDPSQSGRHGKPVLAPPFVEWLMGSCRPRPGDWRRCCARHVSGTWDWPGPTLTPVTTAPAWHKSRPGVPSAAVCCVIPPGPTPTTSEVHGCRPTRSQHAGRRR